MADAAQAPDPSQASNTQKESSNTGIQPSETRLPLPLPPETEKKLEKFVAENGPKHFLEIFAAFSRTTSSSGPDPETAKIMAEAEMHEETKRLEAYKANLENKDKQADRDHSFRRKELNHKTGLRLLVVAVAAGVVALGCYFLSTGKTDFGTPLLVGGGMAILESLHSSH
jgi:hypothetical protein